MAVGRASVGGGTNTVGGGEVWVGTTRVGKSVLVGGTRVADGTGVGLAGGAMVAGTTVGGPDEAVDEGGTDGAEVSPGTTTAPSPKDPPGLSGVALNAGAFTISAAVAEGSAAEVGVAAGRRSLSLGSGPNKSVRLGRLKPKKESGVA